MPQFQDFVSLLSSFFLSAVWRISVCVCLLSCLASFHQHQRQSRWQHHHRPLLSLPFPFCPLLSCRIVLPLPLGLRSYVPEHDRPIRTQHLPPYLYSHFLKAQLLLQKPTSHPVNWIQILVPKQLVPHLPEAQERLTTLLKPLSKALSHHLHLLPLLPLFLHQWIFLPLHLHSITPKHLPLVVSNALLRLLLQHLRRHPSHRSKDQQETLLHQRWVCFKL